MVILTEGGGGGGGGETGPYAGKDMSALQGFMQTKTYLYFIDLISP
jgi:hypothetical protein